MITLQLIDVPLDADVAHPEGRPMGSREEVIARLDELLPGTAFDDTGHGVFRRGSYQIAFKLNAETPTTRIGVAFNHPDAFAALKRIVDKTGWCLIDPSAKGFVDIETSRALGRTVMVGEVDVAAGAATHVEPPREAPRARHASTFSRWSWLPRISRDVLLAVAAALTLVLGAWRWVNGGLPIHLPAAMALSRQAPSGMLEKYDDRARRREAAMKRLPAAYRDSPVVEQMIDFQMASRSYWNYLGDGRFSSPDLLSSTAVWGRYHLTPFLPETFAQRERLGYRFDFIGEDCEEPDPGWPECRAFIYSARPTGPGDGRPIFALYSVRDRIYVRSDGQFPTFTDPAVDAVAAR